MNGLVRLKFEPEFLSTFGNWDFLGAYLAASLVVGSFAGGVLSFVGNGVSIVAMLFCRSRGAWLALGAVALLWFVFFGGKILRRWQARAITVVLAPIIASLLAWPYIRKQWQLDVRPVIWKATIAMIIDRPVLGHGLGTYVAVYPRYRLPQYFLRPKSTNVTDHAHDELLEIAAEQGLVGFLATLWLWATAVWCGVSAVRQSSGLERRAVLGLLGAALVFMLHGLVDVDLRYLPNQSLLWLLMGLLVGRTATPPGGTYGSSVSRTAQWMLVAVCLALGCWIVVSAIIRPMEADWLDRKARLAREQGEMSATAEYAFRALSLEPFRLSTRYLLAGVLARSPNPSTRQLAIDQCLHIEEFAPDYADVTYNLGELYMAANQVTNAIPYLRRAVEINPYRADRHLALAVALRSTGRNEEAITQLDLAEKLQPGNEAIRAIRRDIQGNP
ncbi:MAG TPA: O-antigen ligase family protein [Verrucomicrobiae bacterium]|nr:O-antigen ligase family protein [Verrucomicrobiae bacterium]